MPTSPPARARRASAPPGQRASRAAAALVLALAPMPALAQLPGLPVTQGGFLRPGGAVAVNYGTADGASTVAAAGAWAPGSGRFTLAAGIGSVKPDGPGDRRTAGGLRAALPISTPWTRGPTSAFGIVGFIGAGGLSVEEGSVIQIPVGVSLGYRRRLGESRAVALFAAPFFAWHRTAGGEEGTDADSNLFRTTIGADLLATRRIGITAAYELGAKAEAGNPGPTGGLLGVGVSYMF